MQRSNEGYRIIFNEKEANITIRRVYCVVPCQLGVHKISSLPIWRRRRRLGNRKYVESGERRFLLSMAVVFETYSLSDIIQQQQSFLRGHTSAFSLCNTHLLYLLCRAANSNAYADANLDTQHKNGRNVGYIRSSSIDRCSLMVTIA